MAHVVGLNDFGGDAAEQLYPCCTARQTRPQRLLDDPEQRRVPAVRVWSSEWQKCGTSLAHPPSWDAQSCSATLTVLWQFCDGTGICNGSDVDRT